MFDRLGSAASCVPLGSIFDRLGATPGSGRRPVAGVVTGETTRDGSLIVPSLLPVPVRRVDIEAFVLRLFGLGFLGTRMWLRRPGRSRSWSLNLSSGSTLSCSSQARRYAPGLRGSLEITGFHYAQHKN